MGAIGPWQIVIIALVVLILFGSKRLADIGKGLGEGIRNFKKGVSEDEDRLAEDDDEPKKLSGKDSAKDDDEGAREKAKKES